MELAEAEKDRFNEALARAQLRPTKQREAVYHIIWSHRTHPTADDVFALAKDRVPGISLATVYNCLESLVDCELVREVNFGRRSTRYEPNLEEHAHFYCVDRDEVHDIEIPDEVMKTLQSILPEGFNLENFTIKFNGTCDCHHD